MLCELQDVAGLGPRRPRRAYEGGENMVTVKDLEAFGEAWNRHDVEFIMTFMSDDCVFETTAGKEACGTRYEGRERVREAFAKVFKIFPDAHFGDARHFVAGDRGLSQWLFTGTTADGKKIEVTAATCSRSSTARSPSRTRTSRAAPRSRHGPARL